MSNTKDLEVLTHWLDEVNIRGKELNNELGSTSTALGRMRLDLERKVQETDNIRRQLTMLEDKQNGINRELQENDNKAQLLLDRIEELSPTPKPEPEPEPTDPVDEDGDVESPVED